MDANDIPFDDYCAGKDCRNCKGINCTCPHHAPIEPQKDIVVEARTLAEYVDGLAAGLQDVKLGRAADSLRQLCEEVQRLRGLVRTMDLPRGD